jgi:DUF1009 family protein
MEDILTQVMALIGALVTVATIIVKLTPTQDDDTFLAKVMSFLERVGIDLSKAK